MRKIVVSVLIFAISISAFAVVNTGAFAYTDFCNDEEHANDLPYMERYHFMDGYEDGSFKPDNYITRAEFSKSISIIYEVGNPEIQPEEIDFVDVPSDYWAYNYIAKAVSIGAFSGYDDNSFHPNDYVTYQQAAKIIFGMLGYEPVAKTYGGFPEAYMSLAYHYRFYTKSQDERMGWAVVEDTAKAVSYIRRGEAAYILQSAMFVPLCIVWSYGEDIDGSPEPFYNIGGDGEVERTLFTQSSDVTWGEKINGKIVDKSYSKD